MRPHFSVLLAATALFAVSSVAYSQTWQPSGNAEQPMPQSATTSQPQMAQPAGSMNRYDYDSTGPQPGGSSGSGRARSGAPCVVGLSCDIYQGS
ncbi:conserved exported hypothetical protein [Paraburkholderia sabiae]|nr:conserved exported hypothetical protein [Paraburkholderia sabiae]